MSGRVSVLFDATSLPPSWGGVARYIEGVLTGFAADGVDIDVVAKASDIERLRAVAPSHRYHPSPRFVTNRVMRFAWEQLGLPRLASRLGVAAIHSPHYTLPLLTRAIRVVTVHDATFFTDPGVHSRIKGVFFRRWIRWAGATADAVITPSRATADALAANVRIRTSVVVVAYLGVDHEIFRPPHDDDIERFAVRHGLDRARGWIAFLGTIEPRKNLSALIRSRLSLSSDNSVSLPPLVISGSRGWDGEAIALLDSLSGDDAVREVGYLPLDELSAFLGGATLVAYPSLGEGFGLPVLEAMACGTAVLTTRRLSIPEVGGDAVAYSEPDDDGLKRALSELLTDSDRRHALGEHAIRRAAGFTWEACAQQHLTAYAATGALR